MTRRLSRRSVLSAIGSGIVVGGAGCVGSGDSDDEGDNSGGADSTGSGASDDDTDGSDQSDGGSGGDGSGQDSGTGGDGEDYDVEIDYESLVATADSEQYDLPQRNRDDWKWIVVDLEVVDGEFNMEDMWFRGLFETEERYYTVSHSSSDVEYGIESRGSIQEGGRGVILHDYPPEGSDLIGLNLASTHQEVGGDGVHNDGPTDLYPSVSLEYTVERSDDPDILPSNAQRRLSDNNTWAVITLDVVGGVLNMEDVWFRSQLLTETRTHDLDHISSDARKGIRSRGLVKEGNQARAVYQIGNDESVDEWGYEDQRQDVDVDLA